MNGEAAPMAGVGLLELDDGILDRVDCGGRSLSGHARSRRKLSQVVSSP